MRERPDPPWLIALANDISDGRSVDWDRVSAEPEFAANQAIVEQLRRLAAVVHAHRMQESPTPDPAEIPDAPRSDVWRHLVLLETVGKGAYGTVHRAWDPHLDREVAVKLLSQTSALDEARHLARVRHPNVVTVYGAEQIGERVGIWMEFIDGETLTTAIAGRGPMSAREAAGIGIDLCRAVFALHRAGLLHGDIKADNIMREVGGRIVLMDFSGAHVPTSERWRLSGTPPYIAPEVFQGRAPSFTADLYSLGVLLFYLLTGRYPVEGGTVGDIRERHAAGQRRRLRDVRPGLPDALVQAVERAIALDPAQRFQTTGQLEDALAATLAAHGATSPASAAAASPRRAEQLVISSIAAILTIAATLGVLAIANRARPENAAQPPIAFSIGPPYNTGSWPRLSPDGRLVVFGTIVEGRTLLWVKPLGSTGGRPLPNTETTETPFWSADSQRIVFLSNGTLRAADVATGRIENITRASTLRGGDWHPRGLILFADDDGIFRVAPDGSTRVPVTTVARADGEYQHGWPEFLPDGRHFLYIVRSYRPENSGLYLGSIDSTARTRIMSAYSRVVYSAPGRLLFVRDGTLVVRAFDPASGRLSGEAVPLAGPIKVHAESDAAFDVSASGILVYRLNEGLPSTRIVLFDRRGREVRALTPVGSFRQPRFSPDGTRIAVERVQNESQDSDIWLLHADGTGASRFTTHAAPDLRPAWSPDGTRVAFSSKRTGSYQIFVKSVDARDDERLLWRTDGENLIEDWAPDGQTLAVNVLRSGLWRVPLDRRDKPSMIRSSASGQNWQSEFSRDGRWLAYTSEDSGVPEVYVEPHPATGSRWQVSVNGGTEPHWRADSRELVYLSPEGWITSIALTGGPIWKPGIARRLFRISVPEISGTPDFSIAPDGELFVVNMLEGDPPVPPIHVVVNWQRTAAQ